MTRTWRLGAVDLARHAEAIPVEVAEARRQTDAELVAWLAEETTRSLRRDPGRWRPRSTANTGLGARGTEEGGHYNTRKVQCHNGHPFTPENTHVRGTERRCRVCDRDKTRARRREGATT